MPNPYETLLQTFKARHSDTREQLFDLYLDVLSANQAVFSGRVLDAALLAEFQQAAQALTPSVIIDTRLVTVLRREPAERLHVAVNLTSLHREPSWLAEQLTQLLYGAALDVLAEDGRWVFVRCADGYLGWAYRPYLSAAEQPPATHLVTAPAAALWDGPHAPAAQISRIFGGTAVQVLEVLGSRAYVQANRSGWLALADLRALDAIPHIAGVLRDQMLRDAFRMIGVPYVWGGSAANGIDCSGFAQLVHRWAGITLRRDADMQMADGRPVEPQAMRPGDLAFFGEAGETRKVTHVALSLGGWKIIHSSRANNGVYCDDIQQVEHLRTEYLGSVSYLPE